MSFSCGFPNEILMIIFNFCDEYTLSQISMVCTQFNCVSHNILNTRSQHLLVTNQKSKKFCERCKPLLSSYKSKFMTHSNWINGVYRKSKIRSQFPRKYVYPLQNKGLMTKDTFWSYDNFFKYFYAYPRTKKGTLSKKPSNRLDKNYDSDIFEIAYCGNEIISGHQDGSIRHWRIVSQDKKNNLQQSKVHFNVHITPVNKIDATSQYIISCSQKDPIKIKKNIHEEDGSVDEILYSNKEQHLVQSIAIDPTETKFAAGISDSILIYDIDKNFSVMEKKHCSTQLLWEDPHTILTHFTSYIQKVDIRTSKIVRTWDSSLPGIHNKDVITCFSSDNLYTIVTGTDRNQIILWDQRNYASIQAYNVNDNELDARVYSVQFDSTQLYAETEYGLFEWDFYGKKNHLARPHHN